MFSKLSLSLNLTKHQQLKLLVHFFKYLIVNNYLKYDVLVLAILIRSLENVQHLN